MTGLRWIAILTLTLALTAGCSSGNRYPAGGFLGVWSPRCCNLCLHDDCDECQSCESCESGFCQPTDYPAGQCDGCSDGRSEWGDGCRPSRGCYPCGYEHCKDTFITGHSARKCARNALDAMGLKSMPSDFRNGFIQAYEDIADGQSGATPPVPPSKYWTAYYRSAEGKQHAQNWFTGYRAGANSALGKKPAYYGPIADSGVAYSPEPVPRSMATSGYYGDASMMPQPGVYYPPMHGQVPMMGIPSRVPGPVQQTMPAAGPMSQPIPPAPTGPPTAPQTIQQRAVVPQSAATVPNQTVTNVNGWRGQPVSQGRLPAEAYAPMRAPVMNPEASTSSIAQFMPAAAVEAQPATADQLHLSVSAAMAGRQTLTASSVSSGGSVPAGAPPVATPQAAYGFTPSGQFHLLPSGPMPMSNPIYGVSTEDMTPVSPSYRPQMPSAYQNYRN